MSSLLPGQLPAPPRPPAAKPVQRSGVAAPSALLSGAKRSVTRLATAAPAQATVLGSAANGSATTLVLYDTTDAWGWLGELYAMAAGNLASHFGTVTAEPVVNYVSGQVNNYTATVYLGSTYNEPIPATFLNDALSTSAPVLWAGDNVWQLSGTEGGAADQAFQAKYGWDPSTSYFDTSDTIPSVSYKNETFTRSADNTGGILAPHITNSAAVTVLANGQCVDATGAPTACASIAQTTGSTVPWAIRSANLTYVGEIPFSYINETDRYVAYSDLLFGALDPTATPTHQALVRLEDVSAADDPSQLQQVAQYLYNNHIPYSVNVIPDYVDPNGFYNNGVAQNLPISRDRAMVKVLNYIRTHGGTLGMEGYTHQYSTIANPYSAVSGDDFEFYRAQCSTTQNPPYQFETPCQNTDWVIEEGPVPGDSSSWAQDRVTKGLAQFSLAGLGTPGYFVAPHYAASAIDYQVFAKNFPVRYDRTLYFGGQLSGQPIDDAHVFGQFFPYLVHDTYGTTVLPENLGDYEPTPINYNPVRLPADIVHEAQLNLAVTQGVASFFYDPSNGLAPLQQTISGVQGLGYTFVSPQQLIAAG